MRQPTPWRQMPGPGTTRTRRTRRTAPMGNILTLAQKELRAYFVSPIAYVLLVFFALLFGYFYVSSINFMIQLSMGQFGMGGPQIVNINEFMIRPLFGNTAVILLFMLPMLTMRSFAEEKRSGTIELLLTSPLTDFQIIMGKFLGAMALYTLMLSLTLVHIGVLFWYGEPEWAPVLSGYLGLLLMGGSFISIGLAISSMTKNQIVAGVSTFAVLLLFWIINWMGDASGTMTQSVLAYLSILEHLDDFSKGVIDTTHVTYYVSFITLGLFLTAKSMDMARWNG
ncbi:MAG: ABC transporter [Candidatus Neomarinimicrobiota bacterium]|nr:MAG: ABC transporter [Candidatus Neomarinimicrobiota bacterium]